MEFHNVLTIPDSSSMMVNDSLVFIELTTHNNCEGTKSVGKDHKRVTDIDSYLKMPRYCRYQLLFW